MKYYGISQVGQYHIDEGSDVCQDAFAIEQIDETTIVAAVADGVGSEKYSDIASDIAVKTCVSYCREFYSKIEDKLVLLSNSFQEALFSIQDKSKESEIPLNQLDCTLCAIILTDDKVYCGNVGDSGSIGLSKNGEYILLTEQQNDENGAVFPLASQASWQFYTINEEFTSVLLATDGFYNYLFPRYLAVNPEQMSFKEQKVLDYEKAARFMDPRDVEEDTDNTTLQDAMERLVNDIPREGGWDGIIDDLTVVGLLTNKGHEINADFSEPLDRENLKKTCSDITKELLYGKKKETEEETIEKTNEGFVFSSLPPIEMPIPRTETEEDRIRNIIEHKPARNILNKMEWPLLIIRDGKGNYHDYVTTHIGKHEMISEFLNNNDNMEKITRRANIAFNLAVLMKECHENGIIYGVVSQNNIGVGEKREIYFLNPDEKLMNISGIDHEVPVNILKDLDPGFESKEENVLMTLKQMENTVLSLTIFKLFFRNSSPFRKENDTWSFVENKDKSIPDLTLFPDYMVDLFYRAFGCKDIGKMPEASEWYEAINRYSEEVIRCDTEKDHVYYKSAAECPYCKSMRNGAE